MPKVSILMYHQVGCFDSPAAHRSTFCHVRRFKAQMTFLSRFGYTVISLQDALDGLFGGKSLADHSVVLTFDDGYQGFKDHAFPVLQHHGFPASVFLVAGLLDGSAKWLADEGRHAPKLLDRSAVRELQSAKISFGSHTMTHPFLSRLDPARRRDEIRTSKTVLEDLLEQEIRHFCYPDGNFDDGVVAEVKAAGYTAGLTCIRGSATPADNPWLLPRKAISFGDSLIGVFWKLHLKHKKKIDAGAPSATRDRSSVKGFPAGQ
jgi:peptidoglycan/xylan/chitin deacetylase (PgdA/CDA1 family)